MASQSNIKSDPTEQNSIFFNSLMNIEITAHLLHLKFGLSHHFGRNFGLILLQNFSFASVTSFSTSQILPGRKKANLGRFSDINLSFTTNTRTDPSTAAHHMAKRTTSNTEIIDGDVALSPDFAHGVKTKIISSK